MALLRPAFGQPQRPTQTAVIDLGCLFWGKGFGGNVIGPAYGRSITAPKTAPRLSLFDRAADAANNGRVL